MFLHKNSQKRIYFPGAVYFITTVTKYRVPFFSETILCKLFIAELKLCKELKKFHLLGFVIMPDHVHLLIYPDDQCDISEIMRSLKTNFSRNVNVILNAAPEGAVTSQYTAGAVTSQYTAGAVTSPRLLQGISLYHHDVILPKYKKLFYQKYGGQYLFPKFQWQKSFFDHIIRDEKDLFAHLEYIWHNSEKHGLTENFANYQFSSYNIKYQSLIDLI